MVRITGYDKELVFFHCDKCDQYGVKNVSSMIKDDCVFAVKPLCAVCGDSNVVYILHCKTEYKAKELFAELEVLKSRWEG